MKITLLLLISLCYINAQPVEYKCQNVKPNGPIMCPEIYQPVCATLSNNTKLQFSNSCFACGSKDVISYTKGVCINDQTEEQTPLQSEGNKVMCTLRTKMCPKIYMPVCGYFNKNIQCIRAPCAQDYSNYCMACGDENVEYYLPGKCESSENPQLNQDQSKKVRDGFKILSAQPDIYICPDVRPEICTLEYAPHCGFFNNNISCFAAPCAQTYGNQCSACSDSKVAYVKYGDCSLYKTQINQDTQSGYQITVKIAMVIIIAALALFL